MTDHEFDATTARLAEIRARAEAATAGPLTIEYCGKEATVFRESGRSIAWSETGHDASMGVADAEFLTAARADVLWLLAKVDRLTGERDRAQALADRLHEERLAVLAGVSKVVRRTTAADLYASLAGPSRGEQPEAGGE